MAAAWAANYWLNVSLLPPGSAQITSSNKEQGKLHTGQGWHSGWAPKQTELLRRRTGCLPACQAMPRTPVQQVQGQRRTCFQKPLNETNVSCLTVTIRNNYLLLFTDTEKWEANLKGNHLKDLSLTKNACCHPINKSSTSHMQTLPEPPQLSLLPSWAVFDHSTQPCGSLYCLISANMETVVKTMALWKQTIHDYKFVRKGREKPQTSSFQHKSIQIKY